MIVIQMIVVQMIVIQMIVGQMTNLPLPFQPPGIKGLIKLLLPHLLF